MVISLPDFSGKLKWFLGGVIALLSKISWQIIPSNL